VDVNVILALLLIASACSNRDRLEARDRIDDGDRTRDPAPEPTGSQALAGLPQTTPRWMVSPPAEPGLLTIDHTYAPILSVGEVVLASTALGCTGLDLATGRPRWREPLDPPNGPVTAGHRASSSGPSCPAPRLHCLSPHAPIEDPWEDPGEEVHDTRRRLARAAGVPAIQVLAAASAGARRMTILALRLDTTLTRDALAAFEGQRLHWIWPIPPPRDQVRAEPMAVAADAERAVLFFDSRHAALFPLE
jgi:hypothetical protein